MRRDVHTLCPYCGVGCGLIATTDGTNVLRVRGDPAHPANLGRVCPKGGSVGQTVNVPTRMRHPMIRHRFGDPPQIIPPVAAIRQVADRLNRIRAEHGPSAIAFYLSGQLTTEAQYIANKFAKGVLGTNHCDSNSRLCMSGAAVGMKLSFGSDGPPTTYADIELADAFLFVGSNAADAHPVTFERIKKRIAKGARCVVADPRRTNTADAATLHLPVRPATDLTLMNGLLHMLRAYGKIDRAYVEAHTEGWAALAALLDEYPPARVARDCGITQADLVSAARIVADADKLITFWTMGVNQTLAGTFTVNAIVNLHLATGRVGKPGAGPFSLTGQPNAMGGRDVGYMSHTLPGYRAITNPEDRAAVESVWGLPAGSIKPEPGYDAVQLFDALDREEIKAIWIIGSNPAASMPNLPRIRRALEKAELVIVQDAYYPNETTPYAHVMLPAAVNLEQDGTFCNSERRVTLMQQVVPPPGEAKPDWYWVRTIAQAMGMSKGMAYGSAADIFDEFARSTAGRPNDQSGLYHGLLADKGPQQWPFPSMGQSHARRYTDGVFPTATGKARLWARDDLALDERPTRDYPLLLTTGRTLNQWHTRTKTGTVSQLNDRDPGPYLQIHPDDAVELGIVDGDWVDVVSERGAARSTAKVDDATSPGVVFMPIHWNELWGRAASPNEATTDATDPISQQPAVKCCAVRVEKVGAARPADMLVAAT
jgi:anaerobic selenocysteine-containing dehydrogenase